MTYVRLAEVVDFTNGGTPSRKNPEYWKGSIPWITGADIPETGKISARSFISEAAVKASSTNVVPAETVLLLTRTSVGKVGVLHEPMAINQDITAITPRGQLDGQYLKHFLKSSKSRLLQNLRGATIKGVSRDDVASLEIALPGLPEQRRIAAILDHADTLRWKRRDVLRQLDGLVQSVFTEMFPSETPAERITLGDLATLITKGTTPTSVGREFSPGGVPFLRAQNLQRGTVAFEPDDLFINMETDLALKRSRIRPRDLLISIAGTIGRAALVPEESPAMNCNQAVAIVRLAAPETGSWLRAWLASADARSQIGASTVTGTISNLSLGQIRQLKVPVVGEGEVAEFNRRIASVETANATAANKATAEQELLSSLQSRAFRGEL